MSSTKFANIARLMTSYNFEINPLPDSLKCAKCKLVLKDAYLVSCGCTFCRICIDDMRSCEIEFCPGDSENCVESSLSRCLSDFRTNNIISKITVKCPHDGCVHECQLVSMEEHLRQCSRKNVECPFRELGCTQNDLAAEEMNGHLLRENRRHSEILISMVANIHREIEILKQRDEDSKKEIEMLKHELVRKDDQINAIIDQMIHLENENKSIAVKYNPIKRNMQFEFQQGKDDLVDRLTILQGKIEQETAERRENDEQDSARVIEHVGREIAAITAAIGSHRDELATEISSLKDDIQSVNRGAQSKNDEICSMKSQVESIQALVGQVDGKCEFVIEENLFKTTWTYYGEARTSDSFIGPVHPYKFKLRSYGCVDNLQIELHIHTGPDSGELAWPFNGQVAITVSDKHRRHACRSISRQCRSEKPSDNTKKCVDVFKFLHSELIAAGLDLSRGVRVSCVIVPSASR